MVATLVVLLIVAKEDVLLRELATTETEVCIEVQS